MNRKYHWYLVSGASEQGTHNKRFGLVNKNITESKLDWFKECLNTQAAEFGFEDPNVVITGISYLGEMTEDYFKGGQATNIVLDPKDDIKTMIKALFLVAVCCIVFASSNNSLLMWFVALLAVFSIYLAAIASEERYFLQAKIKKLNKEISHENK